MKRALIRECRRQFEGGGTLLREGMLGTGASLRLSAGA